MRLEKIKELEEKIDKLKVLELKRLNTEARFLKTESYEVHLAGGQIFTREKLLKAGRDGNAVIILPYINEKEVLITIEPRVFTKRGVGIGLAAGYIEKGEEPIEAARRELLEETGCMDANFINLGSFYQDTGCSASYNTSFLATDLKNFTSQRLDKDEYIENMIIREEELEDLIEMGYINDANALITIEKAKKYLRRKK